MRRNEYVSQLAGLPVRGLAGKRVNPPTRQPANPPTGKGFTLIELLVAASIAAIIALAVGATFAGGLKVYRSIEGRGGARTDVLLCLEKMEGDLRSMLALSDITFNGGPKKITFAGIVNSSLGSVTYYLDEKGENLIRKEENYPQALAEGDTGEIIREKLISVKDISFTYFIYNADLKDYEWTDSWMPEFALEEGTTDEGGETEDEEETEDERTPLGVKIELSYEDRGKDVTRTRTVFMPVAVSRHMAMLAKQREEKAKEDEE